jgi:hypothetical protein
MLCFHGAKPAVQTHERKRAAKTEPRIERRRRPKHKPSASDVPQKERTPGKTPGANPREKVTVCEMTYWPALCSYERPAL